MTVQVRPRLSLAQTTALQDAHDLAADAAPHNDPRIYLWEALDSRLRDEQVANGSEIRPRLGMGEIEALADLVAHARKQWPDHAHAATWVKLERRFRREHIAAAIKVVEHYGGTVTNLVANEACTGVQA
jgi:hypothetical protein